MARTGINMAQSVLQSNIKAIILSIKHHFTVKAPPQPPRPPEVARGGVDRPRDGCGLAHELRFTTTRTPACCSSSVDRGTGTSFCEPTLISGHPAPTCVHLPARRLHQLRRQVSTAVISSQSQQFQLQQSAAVATGSSYPVSSSSASSTTSRPRSSTSLRWTKRTKTAAATPQLLLGMGGFRDRASSWPRCWGLDVSSDLQAGLAAPRAGDVYWRAVCTWCPIHSNHSEYMDCSVFSSTSRRPPNHVPAVPGIRAQRTMARWSLRTQFLKSDGGQAGMRTSFINLRLVIHYH